MQRIPNQAPRNIYSVSELTKKIKALLENKYSFVWISGEISNIRIPGSGHAYFNLKDKQAQISAVMFKGQLRNLKFELENGATIIGLGRITVYEPRGNYQIILEYIEPRGVGALQLAFEQLKRKLDAEGLFDKSFKKPLPFLPHGIGVITSPSGAVIKDIFKVIHRRFPCMDIDLIPVRVQGDLAASEIVSAITIANEHSHCNLIIIARGGGSLEDFAAFNSEAVARAIFASQKPVVSAIGHETDVTLSDFVADLRAPTPSAAAEMVVPVRDELKARCRELYARCCSALKRNLINEQARVEHAISALLRFTRKMQDQQLRLDDINERLLRAGSHYFKSQQRKYKDINNLLYVNKPDRYVRIFKTKHELLKHQLEHGVQRLFGRYAQQYHMLRAALGALNPTAILNRGYSITRSLPHGNIVRDANQVQLDDELDIQLAHGSLTVNVVKKNTKP